MPPVPAKAPDGFAEVALAFASFGLAAKNITGRHDLADRPLQVFTSSALSTAALLPDALMPSSWTYLVLNENELAGLVNVYEREGRAVASSMEFTGAKPTLKEALQLAGDALTDGGELRLIEIPQIGASFIWVTGSRPTYIDRVVPKAYSEEEFVFELRRRLHSRGLV